MLLSDLEHEPTRVKKNLEHVGWVVTVSDVRSYPPVCEGGLFLQVEIVCARSEGESRIGTVISSPVGILTHSLSFSFSYTHTHTHSKNRR